MEELQAAVVELDAKHKADLSKMKKKSETETSDYELQLDAMNKANADLAKTNKILSAKIKVFDKNQFEPSCSCSLLFIL